MKVVCFVLVNFIFRVIDGVNVKPKSVNLALETVLRFDKENIDADVGVINKVQNFLDTVKKRVVSSGRRRNAADNLKLTEFIKESAKILKQCNDTDLEDVFAVLDDEMRKYHYKGCKFYELVDNIDVRRYVSNQLEQAKGAPASKLRDGLEKVVITIENDTFNGKDKSIIQLLNSLYTGANQAFRRVLKDLEKYKVQGADGMNLPKFLSNALRTLLFDHYSNLNDNARSQVKNALSSYWYNNSGKVNLNGMTDEKREKIPRLRVIDVDHFNNKEMHSWSRFIIQITRRPVLRDVVEYNVLSKEHVESKPMSFKVTAPSKVTEKPTTTVAVDLSTKFIFNDEDYQASKSEEEETMLQTKGKKKHDMLRIKPSNEEGELFLNPKEFTRLSANTDYARLHSNKNDEKNKARPIKKVNENPIESLEIEFITKKKVEGHSKDRIRSKTTTEATLEIIEREPYNSEVKTERVKVKKKFSPFNLETQVTNYYGQAVNPNDGFLTEELEDAAKKQNTLSLEDNLSIETKAKETVEVDSDSIGLLVGGQKVENMNYRSDQLAKKLNVRQNAKKDKETIKVEPRHKHKEKKYEKPKRFHLLLRNKKSHDEKPKTFEIYLRNKEKKKVESKKIKSYLRNVEKKYGKSKKVDRYLQIKDKKAGNPIKSEFHEHKMKKHKEPKEISSSVRHKVKKHEKSINIESNVRHKVKEHKEPKPVEEIFAEHSAVINVELPIVRIEQPTTSKTAEGLMKRKRTHKHTRTENRPRKNKKTTHEQEKSHKSKSEHDLLARKAFGGIDRAQDKKLEVLSNKTDALNSQRNDAVSQIKTDALTSQKNDTDSQIESILSKLETQLEGVKRQIEEFSQTDFVRIDTTGQVRTSAPSMRASSSPPEETRITTTPTIKAERVTRTEVKLANPMVTRVITNNIVTSTTTAKPAPVYRSKNNDNVSSNIVLREVPDPTVPPTTTVVRKYPQKIISSNVMSDKTKANKLPDTNALVSGVINFADMFDKDAKLVNDKVKNIQSLPKAIPEHVMRSNPAVASPSGKQEISKDLSKMKERLRSIFLNNLKKIQELPPVPDTTLTNLKVTAASVTLDDEMEDMKTQWENLKANMAPFGESVTTEIQLLTAATEDDDLKGLQDLQINK